MVTQTIRVNLNQKDLETILAVQSDTLREIAFEFYATDDEEAVQLDPDEYEVKFNLLKPDNNFVMTTFTDGIIKLSDQMTAVTGTGYYCILLMQDDELIYSGNGKIIINDHVIGSENIDSVSEADGYTFPDDFYTKDTPLAVLDDNTTSTTSTWSSSKISTGIASKASIDDNATNLTETWSSDKIATELAGKPDIDDTAQNTTDTWSSEKINSVVQSAAQIADNVISTTSTWSSNKINGEINTASTSAIAQLNAMKTGFDGVTYSSPAAMVQGEDQKLQDEIDLREMLYGKYTAYDTTAINGICSLYQSESSIYTYTGTTNKHVKIVFETVPKLLKITGVSLNVGSGNEYYLGAFYDSNGARIKRIGTTANTVYTDLIVSVPDTAATLYVNYNPSTTSTPVRYLEPRDLSSDIANIETSISEKEDVYRNWDILSNSAVYTGLCSFTTQESSIYIYGGRKYRKVTISGEPTKIRISGKSGSVGSGSNYRLGAIYDASGARLLQFGNDSLTVYNDFEIDVPAGAKTLYINYADGSATSYNEPTGLYIHNLTNDIAALDQVVDSLDPDKSVILCYGDSLTMGAGGEGTTYPSVLQELVGASYSVKNYGVGGETGQQIAGRQGGVPIIIAPTTISTSGYSDIDLSSYFDNATIGLLGYQSAAGLNPVYVNGQKMELYWNTSTMHQTAKASDSTITITRPSQIKPASSKNRNKTLLIWCGANGWPTGEQSVLIDLIRRMIEYNKNNNYIVLGLTSRSGYVLGDFEALETAMEHEFGYHFINTRDYLVNYGLQDAGITPTAEDEAAISEGKVPPSLLADGIHFTANGYTVIGNLVYNRGKELDLWA